MELLLKLLSWLLLYVGSVQALVLAETSIQSISSSSIISSTSSNGLLPISEKLLRTSQPEDNRKLSKGAKIGIALGVTLPLLIGLIIAISMYRLKNKKDWAKGMQRNEELIHRLGLEARRNASENASSPKTTSAHLTEKNVDSTVASSKESKIS